jgi:hypothetical protein
MRGDLTTSAVVNAPVRAPRHFAHHSLDARRTPDGYRAVAGPLAREPGAEVLVVGGHARSVGRRPTNLVLVS